MYLSLSVYSQDMIKEVKIEGVTCFAKLFLLQIYTHLSTFLASFNVQPLWSCD